MATHNILDKNMPVYHRFVDNQVLTNDQLNSVIDHINYQDKQTRASLIGVGNVCGVEISKNGNLISVSGGVAVTSDGDLIKVKQTVFTGYKKFSDERVKYSHFTEGGTILDLYELKEDSTPTNVKSLSTFDADTSITDNQKVFILYLECYPKEEEDCSPLECNAQGEEVVRNIKILVTSLENAKKIAAKDSIFSSFLNDVNDNAAINIAPIYVRRVVLNTARGASVSALKNSYLVNFSVISNQLDSVGKISLFQPQQQVFSINIPNFFNSLNQETTNFQYLYDFYKDLVAAFNELADSLNQAYTMCCPDPTAFPKHILRGGLVSQTDSFKHKFYGSPIHDHDNSIESLQLQYGRILEMIKNFSVSIKDEIVVTPSKHHHFSLGERALPFYYDLASSINPNLMLNAWKLNNKWVLPNYYGSGYPLSFIDPLDYCLDGHDFFRVEGHVGRDVLAAVKDISDIRNQKGLAFDILPIAVGPSADEATLDYDKYRIYFEDLQVILQAWNEEINCIVSGSSQFLSNFSAVDEGQHLNYRVKAVADDGVGFSSQKLIAGFSRTIDTKTTTKDYTRGTQTTYGTYANLGSYERVNNVVENIATTEGSTGDLWTGLLGITDNKNDVRIKLKDAVNDKVAGWAVDYVAGSVDIPAEVLGALKDMEDNKLLDIEDFTEANLENFIASLQTQCDTGKNAKKTLQGYVSKANSKLKDQIYLEQYYFVLNNIISTCCMIERFRVLYEEILKRKQLLLDDLVLKEFIKKHPSAEHKAGVEEGGTLIVLYYSKGPSQTPISRTKILTSASGSVSASGLNQATDKIVVSNQSQEVKQLIEGYAKLTKEVQSLKRFERQVTVEGTPRSELAEMISFSNQTNDSLSVLAAITGPRTVAISDGTVIGDLCIPYICCAQTPATTFVFPDRDTDLIVTKDHVCKLLDKDADEVPITPTPADGEVLAYVDGEEIDGAIIVKDGKYFFNPNVVSQANYNQEISFTVNGQDVTPTITVYQKPEPNFTFEGPTFSNENTKAKIVITNSTPTIDDQVFEWDFGGTPFENGQDVFNHTFDVVPGESYEFDLILTASNLECSDIKELPLSFDVPNDEVDLLIKQGHLCLMPGNEAGQIPIQPTPNDANVVAIIDDIEIPNLIKVIDGESYIDPNELNAVQFNKVISFTVNGLAVGTTFTVFAQPQPEFELQGDPVFSNNNAVMTINILNKSKVIEGQEFEWAFNEDVISQNEQSFSYQFAVVPGELFNYSVNMKALNNVCSANAEGVFFEINVPDIDEGNGSEQLECQNINIDRIKSGQFRLQEFADINKAQVSNYINIFIESLIPIYDLTDSDIKGVLAGAHDNQIRSTISSVQSQVDQFYSNPDNSEIQKEWLIRLYFETMLLYFYIQACRKSPITAVTKITGNWLSFVDMIIENDIDLVRKVVEGVPYGNMIQTLLDELNNVLSSTLKALLQSIVNKLINIFG